jgi:hypothetical protein
MAAVGQVASDAAANSCCEPGSRASEYIRSCPNRRAVQEPSADGDTAKSPEDYGLRALTGALASDARQGFEVHFAAA